jgi:hypothetical protein
MTNATKCNQAQQICVVTDDAKRWSIAQEHPAIGFLGRDKTLNCCRGAAELSREFKEY